MVSESLACFFLYVWVFFSGIVQRKRAPRQFLDSLEQLTFGSLKTGGRDNGLTAAVRFPFFLTPSANQILTSYLQCFRVFSNLGLFWEEEQKDENNIAVQALDQLVRMAARPEMGRSENRSTLHASVRDLVETVKGSSGVCSLRCVA